MALIFLCLGWLGGTYLGVSYGSGAEREALLEAVSLWPAALASLGIFAAFLGRNDPRLRTTALALACAVLAIWRAFAAIPDTESAIPAAGVAAVRGTISDRPEPRDASLLLELDADGIQRDGVWQPGRLRVLIRTDRYAEWSFGDGLVAVGELRPATGPGYWTEHLARQGIHFTMDYPRLERIGAAGAAAPARALNALRDRLQDLCARLLPEPQASLLAGILVGGRASMPQAFRDALNSTSTGHLVAVSGFNVTVVAGATLFLARRFFARRRATLLAIAAVWAYSLLTGLPPSAARAAVMATMALASVLAGRDSDALSFLALSGAVMVGLYPFLLYDLGFQLSFLATAGLILLEPALRVLVAALPGPIGRAPGWLVASFTVTIAPLLATLPILATTFHTLSLVAPLTNLLLAPALPGLMASGTLAVGAAAVWEPIGRAIAPLAWAYLSYMVEVVVRTASLPAASVPVGTLGPIEIAGFYAVLIGIAVWPMPETRAARAALAAVASRVPCWTALGGAVALVSLIVLAGTARPDGNLRVYFLDVGEGDAVLIRSPMGHNVLVDGGPSPTAIEGALGARLPFLDRDLDAVVLTGYRQDRLAGLLEVARRHRIGLVLQPDRPVGGRQAIAWAELIAERQIPVERAEAGQRIDLGEGGYLDVAWASERGADEPALALRLVRGGVSLLLPGDLSGDAQRELAGSLPGRLEVLRVPGQGAAGALDGRLLRAASPRTAVISVAAGNRHGHPAEATLRLLGATTVFRTDRHGTVELVLGAGGYEVFTER